MKETVNVPLGTYKELIKDSFRLAALESGGVDNWPYYGEAMDDMLNDLYYEKYFIKLGDAIKKDLVSEDYSLEDYVEEYIKEELGISND